MLRIGEFTDTYIPVVDGVGRVVLAYAETLCQKGHQVTVVCPMYNTGYRGGYPFELVDFKGLGVPSAKQYKFGSSFFDRHCRKRLNEIPLDIVHAHSPFCAGAEALRIAKQRKIPLVGTFHSKYYDDFLKITKSESLAKLGVKMVVNFYSHCDDVWAVGDRTAEVLHEYGYKGEIKVIPNGVTPRKLKPEALEDAIARFHIAQDRPVLLFVGQINWKKNILRILEACAILKEQGVSFQMLFAGQGPDQKPIVEKIKELGLEDTVSLIGHITDTDLLDGLYASADLFIFPSLYDNAPMVVREAAVMRTPAVMVAKSSGSEIIKDGVNGFLCDDDSKDLANTILKAVTDRELLERVSENANQTIPVPWDTIVDDVAARYSELIDRVSRNGRIRRARER
ncbi:MAG: glycosyltransferase [Clostridia bacterium]|nr:glycosyltransferase [Clostridia bacterium]